MFFNKIFLNAFFLKIVLKNKNIEPLFVLQKDYTNRFIKAFTGLFIGKNYVANLNANKELILASF